eukprot:2183491-Prymnesium_polylepis.1
MPLPFWPLLARVAVFLRALLNAGMPSDKRDFGQDAMTARHHVPFVLEIIHRCVALLRAGGMKRHGWSGVLHQAIDTAICFCMVRGCRLDE